LSYASGGHQDAYQPEPDFFSVYQDDLGRGFELRLGDTGDYAQATFYDLDVSHNENEH